MRPLFGIYIPTYGNVSIEWHNAVMQMGSPLGAVSISAFDRSNNNIAEKRNSAVEWAIANKVHNLFFLGDDNLPPPETLNKLLWHIQCGRPVITGLYFSRSIPIQPMIWAEDYLQGGYWDWHIGELIQVYAAGCDCLMLNMDYLVDKIERPWFSLDYHLIPPSKNTHSRAGSALTEDFYFYALLRKAGIPVYCDTGILVGHQDRTTGLIYGLPADYPQAKLGSDIPRKTDILIADIGCGLRPDPIHLEGDVVRFDFNKVTQPDVLCDVRKIPEPAGKFDIVLASHILEHLGMWEAPQAIEEWTRILKIGGKLIVRVPNIDWAMKRILERKQSPYDLQMLYGMQTDPGQYHKVGFWKESLEALAQMITELGEIKVEFTGNEGTVDSELTLTAIKIKDKEPIIVSEVFDANDKHSAAISERSQNDQRSEQRV